MIEGKIAHLKGLMADNRVEINDLELIYANLEDDIADARLLTGPWYPNRIPPEILCEIFHCYILFFQHSAWTISQVCRAWRRIALGCSSLWSRLHVTARIPQLSNAYRSPDSFGQGYLTTELQAQRAVRRAKEGPLRVILRLNEGTRDPSVMLRLLKIIAGENFSRWRSLDWCDPVLGDHWTPVLQQALSPVREMASLQRLSLHYSVCHLLVPALTAGVPCLSSLELTLSHGGPPTALMTQPWLRHLKKLTLRNCHQLSPLWPFIAECKALEELGLGRYFYPSGESFKSSGEHPLPYRLRTVRLETHANSWSCVSGLNITSLTLQMNHSPLTTVHVAPRSISLPSLTELSCLSYETAFAAGYLLDAPKTQLMRICNLASGQSPGINGSVPDIFWDNLWGIRPVHVSIMTFDRNRVALQSLLLRFFKVTTLSLCFFFQSVDTLLALVPDSERGDDIALCPNLTRVECKFVEALPSSEASKIDRLILTIQDERENLGLLRPKIDICWGKRAVSA